MKTGTAHHKISVSSQYKLHVSTFRVNSKLVVTYMRLFAASRQLKDCCENFLFSFLQGKIEQWASESNSSTVPELKPAASVTSSAATCSPVPIAYTQTNSGAASAVDSYTPQITSHNPLPTYQQPRQHEYRIDNNNAPQSAGL